MPVEIFEVEDLLAIGHHFLAIDMVISSLMARWVLNHFPVIGIITLTRVSRITIRDLMIMILDLQFQTINLQTMDMVVLLILILALLLTRTAGNPMKVGIDSLNILIVIGINI